MPFGRHNPVAAIFSTNGFLLNIPLVSNTRITDYKSPSTTVGVLVMMLERDVTA